MVLFYIDSAELLSFIIYIMNKFILSVILLFMMSVLFYSASKKENYVNLGSGSYPVSQNNVLLEDVYPVKCKSGVSNNSGHNIWWNYPIFEVGSYEQITNNLKYPNNPDDGLCTPAEFCGALYTKHQDKSNISTMLPLAEDNSGLRINYYTTNP
jgi:hypothetical protein